MIVEHVGPKENRPAEAINTCQAKVREAQGVTAQRSVGAGGKAIPGDAGIKTLRRHGMKRAAHRACADGRVAVLWRARLDDARARRKDATGPFVCLGGAAGVSWV